MAQKMATCLFLWVTRLPRMRVVCLHCS